MQKQLASPKILVVADSLTVCRVITTCLKGNGFAVTWGCSPRALLSALFVSRHIALPALFFVDLCLPDNGGYTMIQWLRSTPEMGKIPIIALCSPDRLFNPLQAHLAGANAAIPKPLQKQQLMDIAQSYLSNPESWMI